MSARLQGQAVPQSVLKVVEEHGQASRFTEFVLR